MEELDVMASAGERTEGARRPGRLSLDELARQRGATAVASVRAMAEEGAFDSDEELKAFVADVRTDPHRRVERLPTLLAYSLCMTSKKQLLTLVDSLPEDQAAEVLRVVANLVAVPEQYEPLPAFVGIGDSGRSDLSTQADDLLAEGFGR